MDMAWYTAIFLGLVQGLAEFLPISSSGHLLLFEQLFGVTNGGLLFTLMLHLATLLAVIVVYRTRLWQMLRHPFCRENWQLLLGTVVTCGLVLIGKDWLDTLFSFHALPWTFIATGVILLLPTIIKKRPRLNPWLQFVVVGAVQGIAVVPGLSRSGLTMTAGQLCGQDQATAADNSFLLSIPIIVASLVYEVWGADTVLTCGWGNLVLAFASAFVAGLVAIKWLLKLVRRFDCRWFAGYLLLLGICLRLYIGF